MKDKVQSMVLLIAFTVVTTLLISQFFYRTEYNANTTLVPLPVTHEVTPVEETPAFYVNDPGGLVPVSANNLFGTFYGERASYYILDNPQLKIGKANVKELTLFFIDGHLVKKKYVLDQDISGELMKTLRKFKIVPTNGQSEEYMSQGKNVMEETNGTKYINKAINAYKIKWWTQKSSKTYEYNDDAWGRSFTYVEQDHDYKEMLWYLKTTSY